MELTFSEVGIADDVGIQYLIALAEFINTYLEGNNKSFFEWEKHGWSLRKNPLTHQPEFISNYAFQNMPLQRANNDATPQLNFTINEQKDDKTYKMSVSLTSFIVWYQQINAVSTTIEARLQKLPVLLSRAVKFFNHFVFPTFQEIDPDTGMPAHFTTPVFHKNPNFTEQKLEFHSINMALSSITPSRTGSLLQSQKKVGYVHLKTGKPVSDITENTASPKRFSLPRNDAEYSPITLNVIRNTDTSAVLPTVQLELLDFPFSVQDPSPYFAMMHPLKSLEQYINLSIECVKQAYIDLFVNCGIRFTFVPDKQDRRRGTFLIDAYSLISFYQTYVGINNPFHGYIGLACDARYVTECLLPPCDYKTNRNPFLLRITSAGTSRPGFLAFSRSGNSSVAFFDILQGNYWESSKSETGLTFVNPSASPMNFNIFEPSQAGLEVSSNLASSQVLSPIGNLQPIFRGALSLRVDMMQVDTLQNEIAASFSQSTKLASQLGEFLESTRVLSSSPGEPNLDFLKNLQAVVMMMRKFTPTEEMVGLLNEIDRWVQQVSVAPRPSTPSIPMRKDDKLEKVRNECHSFSRKLETEFLKVPVSNDLSKNMMELQKIVVEFLTNICQPTLGMNFNNVENITVEGAKNNISNVKIGASELSGDLKKSRNPFKKFG
ncbi:MAG: hypothetical protein JSS53_05020 [Proteobacteria bacterium]|nr:hypothetical protein [Pseudomonadota bacterium]